MPVEVSRKILFVDDEGNVLGDFRRRFQDVFEIETALGLEKAIELMVESGPFAVVVSGLRMEGADGLTFLRRMRKLSGDTVCILLADFADHNVAVKAVNKGRVFRFLTRPCPPDTLLETLNDGLDYYKRLMMAEALQKSEARYHRMVANIPGIVYQFILRADGTINFRFLSDSCWPLFGLDPEHIKADSSVLLDKIHPDDLDEFYRLLAVSAEKLSPCDWWGWVNVAGEQRRFQSVSRPERLANGDTLWDGVILDMTDYRRIEEKVRRLAKFPDENPNPVMRMTDDGVIVYANKASTPLLNMWGTKVGQNAPGDIYEFALSVKESGSYDCIEVKCKDYVFSIVFAPIEEADYVNLYARDITEAENAEAELIKTNQILKEHDRLKNEFVSTVSHELRTPLCIFKNIISNAMAGIMGKISPKLNDSLKTADASIDRLSRIVADFLDVSRIESGVMKLDLKPISIRPVVSEVADSLRTLATAKGIELKTDLCPEELLVNADKDRITQVLTNLIGNAVKFIPTGCQIDIIATDRNDHVEVAVRDNGPGLSKEDMEKIFDRFVQGRNITAVGQPGTGLGLTIARELVEMHNGRIWVESAPAHGCCFYFTVPKYAPPIDSATETKQLVTAHSTTKDV